MNQELHATYGHYVLTFKRLLRIEKDGLWFGWISMTWHTTRGLLLTESTCRPLNSRQEHARPDLVVCVMVVNDLRMTLAGDLVYLPLRVKCCVSTVPVENNQRAQIKRRPSEAGPTPSVSLVLRAYGALPRNTTLRMPLLTRAALSMLSEHCVPRSVQISNSTRNGKCVKESDVSYQPRCLGLVLWV